MSKIDPSPPLRAWLQTRMRGVPTASVAARMMASADSASARSALSSPEAGPRMLCRTQFGEDGLEVVRPPGQRAVVRREVVHEQVGAEFGETAGDGEADAAAPGDAGDDGHAAEQRKSLVVHRGPQVKRCVWME